MFSVATVVRQAYIIAGMECDRTVICTSDLATISHTLYSQRKVGKVLSMTLGHYHTTGKTAQTACLTYPRSTVSYLCGKTELIIIPTSLLN